MENNFANPSLRSKEDGFPADELILQKAVAGVYRLDRSDKKKFLKDLENISAVWSPYRSYASLHLWRWKPETEK